MRNIFGGKPRIRCTGDKQDNTHTCEVISKTKEGEEQEAIVRGRVTDVGIEIEGEEGPQHLTDLLKDHMNKNVRIKRKTGEF
jgi:hypothetical protein